MGRVTDTISGSLATFRTPGKQAIRSLKAYFTPKQEGEGTPSPDNVRPISGWMGVTAYRSEENLIPANLNWLPQKMKTVNGKITISVYNCFWFPVPKGTIYFHKRNSSVGISYMAFIDKEPEIGDVVYGNVTLSSYRNYTFDNSDGHPYAIICGPTGTRTETASEYCLQNEICVTTANFNSLVKYPEPYVATTLPIDWSSAGTVYGGYVDLVTGEVWETWGLKDLGTVNWTKYSNRAGVFYSAAMAEFSATSKLGVLCNKYASTHDNVTEQADKSIGDAFQLRARSFAIYDTDYADATVAEFKTAMSGVLAAYPLAEHVLVTTLTPTALRTLIGTNNIWCNSGDVSVEYDFAESREMQEARKRVLFSMMWIGGREMKLKKIGTYTVTESWENDRKGNPVTIMNTLVPDRDDTNYEVGYWLEFIGNATSNTNYKVDGIFWNPIDASNKGFAIRNNRSVFRANSSSTSTWASVDTRINIYKIQLFS